jgi:hypothetical protein
MPDQDRQTGQVSEPTGSDGRALLTVPGLVVDMLREGVYAEIGWAGEALHQIASADDRETGQERFRGLSEHLHSAYALLDGIGWASTVPPVDVQIDLRKDRPALVKALDAALLFAEDELKDIDKRDAKRAERGQAPEGEATIERVAALHEFATTVAARIDALTVEEGEGV